jgi:hypothetical protein
MTAERIFAEDAPKYRARGWSVFPVRGKIPCEPWQPWQQEPPHPDQIAAWCEKYPDANIGLATGKVSGVVVLDVDGEEGVTSARNLDLPKETWVAKTGRGWHVYLAHPGNGMRIGNRAGLRPHMDVRGDGGYVVVPRSVHESGKVYEWIKSPDSCPLAPIPPALLKLLLSEAPAPSDGSQSPGRQIPEGQRNDQLYRLARGLLAKGLTPAAIEAALQAENLARCEPPLSQAEVRAIAKHAETQPNRASFVLPAEPMIAPPLQVPDVGMIGIAKDFAELYAEYLEAPHSFFYFSFLTYLGITVAKQITLRSELAPEPRLFTVLIGESADTRKSTALRKTDQFWRSLGEDGDAGVLLGVGSAEGLAAELKERVDHTVLLHFDELKSFVDKAKADNSVLLPMVSTLFERNDYDNRTKLGSISVRGASLALLAACTAETYATTFDARFFSIGLVNRLWIVADRTTQRIAVPDPIPAAATEAIRTRTIGLLRDMRAAYRTNNYQAVPLGLSKSAAAMFSEWYANREGSIFERRLDTYGHRLMVLLAASSGRDVVDEAVMTAVLALLRYELDARRECDPVNAENTIATLEERIRRALARGAVGGWELKKRLHSERVGVWMWLTAIENLRKTGELTWDRKRNLYSLTQQAVAPILAPTSKEGLSEHE